MMKIIKLVAILLFGGFILLGTFKRVSSMAVVPWFQLAPELRGPQQPNYQRYSPIRSLSALAFPRISKPHLAHSHKHPYSPHINTHPTIAYTD